MIKMGWKIWGTEIVQMFQMFLAEVFLICIPEGKKYGYKLFCGIIFYMLSMIYISKISVAKVT